MKTAAIKVEAALKRLVSDLAGLEASELEYRIISLLSRI